MSYYTKPYSAYAADIEAARQTLQFAPDDPYGAGLVAYRLLIELRPLSQIDGPWTPPKPLLLPYSAVAQVMVPALVGIRQKARKGTGFGDIALDLYRLFGPEDWTDGRVITAITEGAPGDVSFGLSPLFR